MLGRVIELFYVMPWFAHIPPTLSTWWMWKSWEKKESRDSVLCLPSLFSLSVVGQEGEVTWGKKGIIGFGFGHLCFLGHWCLLSALEESSGWDRRMCLLWGWFRTCRLGPGCNVLSLWLASKLGDLPDFVGLLILQSWGIADCLYEKDPRGAPGWHSG